MLGILPILIQWLALSQLATRSYFDNFQSYQGFQDYQYSTGSSGLSTPAQPLKSHWTLLNELQQLPEDEIERFLPQICNMVLDRDSLNDPDLFNYFENILLKKCAGCLPFGTRVCGLLKSLQPAASEGLFKNILTSGPEMEASRRRNERLRRLLEKAEEATARGTATAVSSSAVAAVATSDSLSPQLPPALSDMRANYYRDFQFLQDFLTRVGSELKSFPVAAREMHLKQAMHQCNSLLFYRMISHGSISSARSSIQQQQQQQYSQLSAQQIAAMCPNAAGYSLHLPLLRCDDKTMRVLRFVENECEVLPSKERCPYLVVVELLEEDTVCSSHELYAKAAVAAATTSATPILRALKARNGGGSVIDDGVDGERALLAAADDMYSSRSSGGLQRIGGVGTIRALRDRRPQRFLTRGRIKRRFHQLPAAASAAATTTATTAMSAIRDAESAATAAGVTTDNDVDAMEEERSLLDEEISQQADLLQYLLEQRERDRLLQQLYDSVHQRNANALVAKHIDGRSGSSSNGNSKGSGRSINDYQMHLQQQQLQHLTNPGISAQLSLLSNILPEDLNQQIELHRIEMDIASQHLAAASAALESSNSRAVGILHSESLRNVRSFARGSITTDTSSSSTSPAEFEAGTDDDSNYDFEGEDDFNDFVDVEDYLIADDDTATATTATTTTVSSSMLRPLTMFANGSFSGSNSSGNGSGTTSAQKSSRVAPSGAMYGTDSTAASTAAATASRRYVHSFRAADELRMRGGHISGQSSDGFSTQQHPPQQQQQQPEQWYHQQQQQAQQQQQLDHNRMPDPMQSVPHSNHQHLQQHQHQQEQWHHLAASPAPPSAFYPPQSHQQYQQQQQRQQYQQQHHSATHPSSMSAPTLPQYQQFQQQQQQQQLQQQQFGYEMTSSPVLGFVRPKTWLERKDAVRSMSPFGHLPGWNLRSFIVKSGDDLQKEVLAMQLLEFVENVFKLEGVDVFVRPYQILSTGQQAGFVEFLEGALSVDRIKKSLPRGSSLKTFFELTFGASYTLQYSQAVQNFVKSLAAYSLFTYLVQVKDRHNSNLLLDSEGHIVHIDFGFIFGDSPGFNINFESAPFKFTQEYMELLGGPEAPAFKQFQDLFTRGFYALQKHADALTAIVKLFYGDKRRGAADAMRARLMFAQSYDDVLGLIRDSYDNSRTKQYDWYQQRTNGIMP